MELQQNNGSLTVKLSGDLDHHKADEIRAELDEAIDECRPRCLIFDLHGVTFMDSSGVGIIMGRYKKVTAMGGSVCFVGVNNCIDKLVKMSGLLRIIPEIKETEPLTQSG